MKEFIIQIIIGIILNIVGAMNIKGNITSLHSYHRKRVKKEDILPFGQKIGTGSIIIGNSIILAGILFALNYTNISNIIITLGLITGSIIIVYALFKYNKGIF